MTNIIIFFKNLILKALTRYRITSCLLAIKRLYSTKSYLKGVGWFESLFECLPVDKNGQPVPWFTYSAIEFIGQRLKKQMSVFEYGSGNSTVWWGKRVARVVSCEHDSKWYKCMNNKLLDNVEYIYCDLTHRGEYAGVILKYNKEFEIIVIDGKDRINCAKNSLQALKPDGIIIWDNSDLESYHEGYKYLLNKGFKRLDFKGIGPINSCGWCTSLFYRSNNCLGI